MRAKFSPIFLLCLSLIGTTWPLRVPRSLPGEAWWTSVSVSSTGQYQTAVIFGGEIYTSADYGKTWKVTGPAGAASWGSVSVSSTGRHQTATSSGPGESDDKPGGIYISSDFGATWTEVSSAFKKLLWTSVSMSSTGQYQTACVGSESFPFTGPGAIYTSKDYGASWDKQSSPVMTDDWRSVSVSSTGQYQTAVIFDGRIYTSADYGSAWTISTAPRANWISVSVSSGTGQYQTAVDSGDKLLHDNIYDSADFGRTWTIANPTTSVRRAKWNCVSVSSTGQYRTITAATDGPDGKNFEIYTSSDFGAKWNVTTFVTALGELQGGIVSVSATGQYQTAITLALDSGNIYTSSNYGATWGMPVDPGYSDGPQSWAVAHNSTAREIIS
jgi:hypothetical protein